jgi:predicted enzyme related to lactoylglutathione lyase
VVVTVELVAVCVPAEDPERLARFWAGLLGWSIAEDGATLLPTDDTGFGLRFLRSDEPKTVQNLMHPDLTSSTLDHQRETVARALELGARHIDVGQRPEEGHIVLADPEGNELCVLEPGNRFLADCGFFGALACDGTRAVGCFWRDALGWPLVWDEGEETAIRAPHGGPKITWGGPPLMERSSLNRVHFELAPADGADHESEIERLVGLGARRIRGDDDRAGRSVLADPDGNEFRLHPRP